MGYIFEQKHRIRTSEIDVNKKIMPHHMISLMQEASMQQTIAMGLSVWDLESINSSWVLLKMDVTFFVYPTLNEEIIVKTYPSDFDGYFAYRDYFLYNQNNQLCAQISSQWILMNLITRKMVKIPEGYKELIYNASPNLPFPKFKLKPPSTDPTFSYEKTINYFHLDWNGHVNNVHLIKMALSAMPVTILQNFSLTSLKIQFSKEVLLNQVLSIETYDLESSTHFIHKIVNIENRDSILIAESTWVFNH